MATNSDTADTADTAFGPGEHNTSAFLTDTSFGLSLFEQEARLGEPRYTAVTRRPKGFPSNVVGYPCCPACMRPLQAGRYVTLPDGVIVPVLADAADADTYNPKPLSMAQIAMLNRAFDIDTAFRQAVRLVGWHGLSIGLDRCLRMSNPPHALRRVLVPLGEDDIPHGHGVQPYLLGENLCQIISAYLWDVGNSLASIVALLLTRHKGPVSWRLIADTEANLLRSLRRTGYKIQFVILPEDKQPPCDVPNSKANLKRVGWYLAEAALTGSDDY